MPQKPEFIQIEANEDSASVRDRLGFLRGQRVLLIWPENGTALTRKLDLVLVQREAMRLAIRLALVTHDAEVIRHAAELNISTFETIGASERGKWKRGRSSVFTDRSDRPDTEPQPDELMPVASRLRSGGRRRGVLRFFGRLIMLLLLLALTAGVAVLLVPSAVVTITPSQQRLEADAAVDAVVDPNTIKLDVDKGIMPAIIVRAQIEDHASVPTTGKQNVTNSRATGTVVFINKTNSSIHIPAGSQVSTSAGLPIVFRTTEDAVVSAGRGLQIEVSIEAMDQAVGDVGNVQAGMINSVVGPLADQVEVRNVSPTLGGISQTVSVVTQTDHDRLTDILRQQLQDRAYTEMLPRLEDNQVIIPETIHIAEERTDWMTFDHNVGDAADTLSLTMRAVVEATAIDEGLAQQIAYARLAGQIPNGHVIRPETVLYQRGSVTNVQQGGSVNFTMTCSGQVLSVVNVGALQQNLAGHTLQEAESYLSSAVDQAEGTTAQIVLSPEWLPRLPLLPLRITIRMQNPGT